jgi:hypothetical protein
MDKFKQADELLNHAAVVNFRHPNTWAYLAILFHRMERKEESLHAAANAKKWNLSDEELIQKLTELKLFGAGADYEAEPDEEREQHPPDNESEVDDEQTHCFAAQKFLPIPAIVLA